MRTLEVKRDYRWHILHHYNRHAYFYDLMEFVRRGTRGKVMGLSGWQSGEKILDLCTGTGEMALVFASQSAKVVGTDIAREMLRPAVNKSVGLAAAWVEMDATHLAIADGSFRVSMISLALYHMPTSVQLHVLKELHRVTSRRILIIEPDVPVDRRWRPLWLFVASMIDESEYRHEWVYQDFIQTCGRADLNVESVQETTVGLHGILLCVPQMGAPRN